MSDAGATHSASTIVMIDDEPTTLEVLEALLEDEGYTNVLTTTDSSKAMALIEQNSPDVVLSDLVMPDVDGFEILRAMRANPALEFTPVIILTSATDADTKLEALELGATDFLNKPVDPSELVLRIRNTLAAKAYRDRLERFDGLTGLPHRRSFIEQLSERLSSQNGEAKPSAVIHIGLDRFRHLNEALGHQAGDIVLLEIARRIESFAIDSGLAGAPEHVDLRARIGGDEFALFVSGLHTPAAAARAARQLSSFLGESMNVRGQNLVSTASAGIALFPDDGDDAESLLARATTALAHAKQSGRGECHFYSPSLNTESLERLSIEHQLRRAIENDELRLHYQPKVSLHTGEVEGAEALMRWEHPERGLVSPGFFIPIAEETGLIGALGEWALDQVCRQQRLWQDCGLGSLKIAVNMAAPQFRSGLVENVRQALERSGADASRLIIEITENMIMDDPVSAAEMLSTLKSEGLLISIDDFGTGYSSLATLKRFPLDELKIDQSFLKGVPDDGDDAAIVTAIVAMAHSLGLRVVAEGVETEEQLEFIKNLGCDQFQGFFCSPALPPEDWERILADWNAS